MLKGANPRVYISPQSMAVVLNILTVRKLIRVAGKSSRLILIIKSIFQGEMANAWLSLKEPDNRWFDIENI